MEGLDPSARHTTPVCTHLVTESRLFASVNLYACTYEDTYVRVHVHGKALCECQKATAPVQSMLVMVAAATHCTFKGFSQNRCVSALPPTRDRENRAPIDRRGFTPTRYRTERTGGGRKRHARGTARVISRCTENRSVREGLSIGQLRSELRAFHQQTPSDFRLQT